MMKTESIRPSNFKIYQTILLQFALLLAEIKNTVYGNNNIFGRTFS